MSFARMVGTLICYAGSASEASIGSRPLGSELRRDMRMLPPTCQVSPNGPGRCYPRNKPLGGRP